MANYNKITKCRNCRNESLTTIINLGNLCFTGKFTKKKGSIKKAPLELAMCKKCTPGTNIKIISEKSSRLLNPILYLVLPWHFKKEIIIREKNFLRKGGKIYFPLPKKDIFGEKN